jgi:hypothetical protein
MSEKTVATGVVGCEDVFEEPAVLGRETCAACASSFSSKRLKEGTASVLRLNSFSESIACADLVLVKASLEATDDIGEGVVLCDASTLAASVE